MSDCIEIPEANLKDISIFPEEPSDTIVSEIKQHIRDTASPQSWRGHSHTKPPENAFVVYLDKFDVPAPKGHLRVAPCPCCSPIHAKFKNKGKIAWFPHEGVIRLIGPDCFSAIDKGGHTAALIELKKRQKRRSELAIIQRYRALLDELFAVIDQAELIAKDIDTFKAGLNRILESDFGRALWREVKIGELSVVETILVSYQKADGSTGQRIETINTPFAVIAGYRMLNGSGARLAPKLALLRAGFIRISSQLAAVDQAEVLSDFQREGIAQQFPKGYSDLGDILSELADCQKFLSSETIKVLNAWGQHEDSPQRFRIKGNSEKLTVSVPNRLSGGYSHDAVKVPPFATAPIPALKDVIR